MCAILGDYGLLEPFTMQATLNKDKGGGAMHLTGMHRVNEKNLENLNAAQRRASPLPRWIDSVGASPQCVRVVYHFPVRSRPSYA
jgi:hypothetical protein